jgi:hypothetical protein
VETALQNAGGRFQVVVPDFEGGRAGRFLDTDPNGLFGEYVNSEGTIGRPGKTIYISFLMRTSHTTPFFAFELKKADLGDNGARLYVGNDIDGSDLQVCAYRNRDLSEANIGREFQWLGQATTDTEMFVIRIDFGTTGDNVTVYRNPSLDIEPVMDPHLVGSNSLNFDGITMSAWVDPGGRTAHFDEICVASTYADAVRFYNMPARAQNVSPLDGAVDIPGNQSVILSWQAGTGVTPADYQVFFSDVLDDVLSANDLAYQGSTTSTSMTIDHINTDTTYYWSVTETADPNDIPGVIWTFETNKTYPVVVNQPVNQRVFAGEDALFTFEVTSETPEFYQWYDADGILIDGGNISGTQTAALMISAAQIANQGDYYCEVSNSAGTISSNPAELLIKRTVGHWALDQPAGSDPNVAWLDLSGSGNNLQPTFTIPSTYTWTEGADGTANGALVFDGQFALGTMKADGTMNDIPIGNKPYSISAFIKPAISANNGFVGWGNYGTTNQANAIKIDGWNVWHYWWARDLGGTRDYSLVDETWHYVVATYDGTVRAVYIDGLQVASDIPGQHTVPNNENFLIGKTNATDPNVEFFNGALDEVIVYNYTVSAITIAQIYTSVMGGDVCVLPPAYDLTGDCKVNIDDIAALASGWLDCGLVPSCVTEN